MTVITHEEVLERLRQVPEPCSILMRKQMDICQMGLVQDVEIDDAGRVRVELVLTDPSCIHFLPMRRYITDVLMEHPGVTSVEVTMSTTELWTPDRVAPATSA